MGPARFHCATLLTDPFKEQYSLLLAKVHVDVFLQIKYDLIAKSAPGGARTLDLRISRCTAYKYDALTNWAMGAGIYILV